MLQIKVLPHPPKSPYLNPIEHIWTDMSKHMPNDCARRRDISIRNALQAWERLRSDEGQALTAELVASMPRRLEAVLAAGGGYTTY